jgi:putative nucleotidyltransferase with HDIG domain
LSLSQPNITLRGNVTNPKSNDNAGSPLIADGTPSFVWSMSREQIQSYFSRSLYREIIEDIAFQRLTHISFLGAIDFVLPVGRGFQRSSNTRFQHTLGVAKLALRFAQHAQLSERQEKLIVVAALLHDIGHAPLSHSLETVFHSRFSLDHHHAGVEIIRGESPLGKGLLYALQSNGIDADEMTSLVAGKHSDSFVHLFASPMNIDTFEGILRCQRYMRRPVALTADLLLDGLLSFDRAAQTRFDEFWQAKHYAYQFLINGMTGILADALARKYMMDNLKDFSREDYFIGERHLFKKHQPLARLLRRARQLLKVSVKEEIDYKKRVFYLDDSHSLDSYVDLYSRYLQTKSNAKMRVPESLADTSESVQRCLFETACQQ